MVRAVEFATTTKTLLDRDRARLLLSLEKAARRFLAQQDFRSAGVLVAYLVELGLGARRCPADEVDWHFEPLARLVVLNREFSNEQLVRDAQDFSMGTAAAVIKVAEAIAEARLGEHFDRQSGRAWDGSVDVCDNSVITLVERTVEDLRSVPDVGKEFTLKEARVTRPQPVVAADLGAPRNALELAEKPLLEPRGQAAIRPTDSKLLGLVHAVLLCTADQWRDGERQGWISRMQDEEADQKRTRRSVQQTGGREAARAIRPRVIGHPTHAKERTRSVCYRRITPRVRASPTKLWGWIRRAGIWPRSANSPTRCRSSNGSSSTTSDLQARRSTPSHCMASQPVPSDVRSR